MRKGDSMRKLGMTTLLVICLAALFLTGPAVASDDAPRISPEQLKAMLGDVNVIVIDVRQGPDWSESDSKVKGALREDPGEVNSWMNKYPRDKTLVFY